MEAAQDDLVEQLFRKEYTKLIAITTKFFGSAQLNLAEDVVQDTLIAALDHWSTSEIPRNPTGWLVQVAKRKALNVLKREKLAANHIMAYDSHALSNDNQASIGLDNEIEDSQLRMIFLCCHPNLSIEAQVTLTLKTLCGFGVQELAKAMLTTKSVINKRLYRAKEKIRQEPFEFELPPEADLANRLEAVSLTLYLLFNEGYNSWASKQLIIKDFCLEAMRLVKILVKHFPANKSLNALLALMCFHVARFDARIDERGAIILFEDQDRALWNKELIQKGLQFFRNSIGGARLSVYHIEARIAAEHCIAASFESTNWTVIYQEYQRLAWHKPSPIIALNLAIIDSRIAGYQSSLEALEKLENHPDLVNYHLLPATQGLFYLKVGDLCLARHYLKKALALNPPQAEKELLMRKMAALSKNNE